MKINKIAIVLALAFGFYILWHFGFNYVWAYCLKAGISTITAAFSDIQEVWVEKSETVVHLYFRYPDRKNNVNAEFTLPIVLLLAWQTYLFIIKDVSRKFALRSLGFNLTILYLLQIFFPLLLYNVSASKTKATLFFLGLQIFGMLVFFLIAKDNILLKYKNQPKVN